MNMVVDIKPGVMDTCKVTIFKAKITDSNNIILWHESEDINEKNAYILHFSCFQFHVYMLCMIILCSIVILDYGAELSLGLQHLCENCSQSVLKWFQLNTFEKNVPFRGELQINVQNPNFEKFESTLYVDSWVLSLQLLANIWTHLYNYVKSWKFINVAFHWLPQMVLQVALQKPSQNLQNM